ncbi:hypothetical protein Trydic_g10907 [Trypoxylus dichotomus]
MVSAVVTILPIHGVQNASVCTAESSARLDHTLTAASTVIRALNGHAAAEAGVGRSVDAAFDRSEIIAFRFLIVFSWRTCFRSNEC